MTDWSNVNPADPRIQLAIAVNDARLDMHHRNRDELLDQLRRQAKGLGLTAALADIDRIQQETTDDVRRKLRYVAARLTSHLAVN